MGLTRSPLTDAVLLTLLVALAIWVPLRMQDIMIPHNEACFGPFTDVDYRALLRIRLQTWGVSLVATGLCLLAILRVTPAMRLRAALLALFVLWKGVTLFADIYASPVCWEPYANDTPFWDELAGTGLAFWLQPLSFATLSCVLIGLAVAKWLAVARAVFKNTVFKNR